MQRFPGFFSALLLIFFLASGGRKAQAGPFQIINRNYGNVPASNHSDIDTLFNRMEVEVNKALPDADQSTYLKGMSNSTAMAAKGLGVDYATNPNYLIMGYGVGLGADLGNQSFSDFLNGNVDGNQIRGVSAQTAFMGGINLGLLPFFRGGMVDLKRMFLFVNFAKANIPKFDDGLTGDLSSFGVHFQYKLIEGTKSPFLGFSLWRWGGVDFTTGLDRADMNIKYTKTFNESQSEVLGDPLFTTVTGNFTGEAVAGAEISVLTVPLELSTNLQFLYLWSLFGGFAVDLNFGDAKSIATVTGPITVTDSNDTIGNVSATASLDLGQNGGPTSMIPRWFAGFQINLSVLKIYAQLNHGLGQDTYGVNVGGRVAF